MNHVPESSGAAKSDRPSLEGLYRHDRVLEPRAFRRAATVRGLRKDAVPPKECFHDDFL